MASTAHDLELMFQGNGLCRYSADASWPAERDQRREKMSKEDEEFSHATTIPARL